jgi:predicted transcriptional regulator
VNGVLIFPCFLYHEDKLVNRWNLDCEILYGYMDIGPECDCMCARSVLCKRQSYPCTQAITAHGGSSGIAPFIIKDTRWT